MPITFGTPGAPRKTFDDKKFDLYKGPYDRTPCKMDPNFNTDNLKDGMFIAPGANGLHDVAADASRALAMIFTADTGVIYKNVTQADEFPGEDRTDTLTGLVGTIEGCWPQEILFLGARGGGQVALASYGAGQALTVVAGKLCPANFGNLVNEKVIGYVAASAATVGVNAIQARVQVA